MNTATDEPRLLDEERLLGALLCQGDYDAGAQQELDQWKRGHVGEWWISKIDETISNSFGKEATTVLSQTWINEDCTRKLVRTRDSSQSRPDVCTEPLYTEPFYNEQRPSEPVLLVSGDCGDTWHELPEQELRAQMGEASVDWLKEQLQEREE